MTDLSFGLDGPDMTAVVPVALVQPPPTPEGPGGEDVGKSSPVGLLMLVLFFIAVALLVRSMTKHLKRVPASFDEPADSADTAEPKRPKPNGDPSPA